jgi:hypothetical protein
MAPANRSIIKKKQGMSIFPGKKIDVFQEFRDEIHEGFYF